MLIVAAAFCAAVGAAWLLGDTNESDAPAVVEVASRSKGAPNDNVQPSATAPAPLAAPPRGQPPLLATGEPVNIFATKSWEPPPPPPPSPPPPQAPPLPFSFMGMMTADSGKVTYYLARGNQAYAVVNGEKIDNTYRVNGLDGQQLSFTYLPMNEKQVLSMPPPADGSMIGGQAAPGSPPGRPARSAYSPEAPAPSAAAPPPTPGSPAAQDNARKGTAPPGSPPAGRQPAKTPIANQVPPPLSFSPPPQFNMEQSLVTPIGAEPNTGENAASNTGEASAQPSEN
jgi:hypothetical protein